MAPRRYILCQSRQVVQGWQYNIARLLFPLVQRNLRQREAGKAPDRIYWADALIWRLGFAAVPAA